MKPYMQMNARERIKQILNYNQRISETGDSRKILDDWQLRLERDLFRVEGHILKKERLLFGGGREHE